MTTSEHNLQANSPDLSIFCRDNGYEPEYATPWVAGGYRICGNGLTFVFHPTDAPDNDGGIGRIDPAPYIAATNEALKSGRLSRLGNVEPAPCIVCNGRGMVDVCIECGGDGFTFCDHCGSELDCVCEHEETKPVDCECLHGFQLETEDGGNWLLYDLEGCQIALSEAYRMSQLGRVEYTIMPTTDSSNAALILIAFQSGDTKGFAATIQDETVE